MNTNQIPNLEKEIYTYLLNLKTDDERKDHINYIITNASGIDTIRTTAAAVQDTIVSIRNNAKTSTDKLWRERLGRDLGYVSHRIEAIRHDANQMIKRYNDVLSLLNDRIYAYDLEHAASSGLRR